MGNESPEIMSSQIPEYWLDVLMLPNISTEPHNSLLFVEKHNSLFQSAVQNAFGSIQTMQEIREASVLMMRLALYLAYSIGADTKGLSDHWIKIAKSNGAFE